MGKHAKNISKNHIQNETSVDRSIKTLSITTIVLASISICIAVAAIIYICIAYGLIDNNDLSHSITQSVQSNNNVSVQGNNLNI